jgi:hypothetical protein
VPAARREETVRALLDALRRRSPETFRDYRVWEGTRRAVEDLIACCRRRGVRVVLLVPPAESQSRRAFREASAAGGGSMDDAFRAFLSELAAAHGCGVIDASDWVADEGFFDTHHLTPDGAGRFTLRLRGELARLLSGE